MCDYSLQHLESRPAKIGERLVTKTFPNTSSRGFASATSNPNTAVCLMPGTELAFEREIEVQCAPGLSGIRTSIKKTGHRTARFRQINLQEPCAHHDAFELPDGQSFLVTNLCNDQCATVLQMPVDAVHINTETGKRTTAIPEGGLGTTAGPIKSDAYPDTGDQAPRPGMIRRLTALLS
jgi:hypothetical protein